MGDLKGQVLEWALRASRHGGSWWMPLVLLAVCILNSLTGGVFMAVLGVTQSTLCGLVVMSRRRSFILGPVMLCLGGLVAAVAYIHAMRAGGAEALLQRAGSGRSWVEKGQGWAKEYGSLGLVMMSLSPAPTAVIVVVGVLAAIPEATILVCIFGSRFVSLTLGAVALKYTTENMTPEEYIRQTMGAEPAAADAGAAAKKD
mmetsp:Transcript_4966/g.10001  ORF Transcript_4966/g.10001 Transcript_4966/m.10001 type:complete len:201 (-) Transcript_4966:255-857(-)